MATKKFYLTNSAGTLSASPTIGLPASNNFTWNNTAQQGVSLLSETPSGANTAVSQSISGNGSNVMLRRFVTPAITRAGTLTSSGLLAGLILAVNGNATGAVRTAWRIWVVTPTNTVRGTLYNGSGGDNWSATLTGFTQTAPDTVATPVAVQPGDRVVVEIGYQVRTTGTVTGTMRYGGTATTDLAVGDTGTNAQNRPAHITFTGPNSSDLWEPVVVDPGPGGDTPSLIAGYSSPTGETINVPNVQSGDTLLAFVGSIYASPSTALTVSGSGAGTWEPIGNRVGDDAAFANYSLQSWQKKATGSGTYTVSCTGQNETVLAVVHIRGADSLASDVFENAVVQNSSNNVVEAGPVTTTADNTLLIGAFGLVHFNGAQTWTAPSGMTSTVSVSHTTNYNHLLIAVGAQAAAGSSGVKSATSSTTGSTVGEASKLFAFRGSTTTTPTGPEPGRFLLAC